MGEAVSVLIFRVKGTLLFYRAGFVSQRGKGDTRIFYRCVPPYGDPNLGLYDAKKETKRMILLAKKIVSALYAFLGRVRSIFGMFFLRNLGSLYRWWKIL